MAWRRKSRNRYGYDRWPEYVPVAQRKIQGEKEVTKLRKKGVAVNPVLIPGRNIANTFWGKAWCNHIESYSDYDNRLPRGRSYVRNGSVLDLNIEKGVINALVSGSSVYKIKISITPIHEKKWCGLIKECAGKIDSLIELLQGKFSKSVMEIITHQQKGLFPNPDEINFTCSCPDYADMCKHVAAALYGIGARLDEKPEQLFVLRHVDHGDLINVAETAGKLTAPKTKAGKKTLATTDLSSLFGIEIQDSAIEVKKTIPKAKSKAVKKPVKKALPKAKAVSLKTKKTTRPSAKKRLYEDLSR